MKRIGWAMLLVACCIGVFLALPSNYYLRRALTHFLPKIDSTRSSRTGSSKRAILPRGNRRKPITLARYRINIFRYSTTWGQSPMLSYKTARCFSNSTGKIIRQNRTATRFRWQKVLFRWPSDAP